MKTWIFNLLPSSMKRVVIAKDVIAQIHSERFIARSDCYVKNMNLEDGVIGQDVQTNFKKIKNCKVCAIGACVLSITKYKNKVRFSDLQTRWAFVEEKDTNPVKQILKDLFSPNQLYLIEVAFEGYDDGYRTAKYMFNHPRLTKEEVKLCQEFYDKYSDPSNRLIGIMENIIKNKGTFKP